MGYGGKTHYIDSKNTDITAPSGTQLYHLQFTLQAANPKTFGYTLVQHNMQLTWMNIRSVKSRPMD
jgi:hypothetical protein